MTNANKATHSTENTPNDYVKMKQNRPRFSINKVQQSFSDIDQFTLNIIFDTKITKNRSTFFVFTNLSIQMHGSHPTTRTQSIYALEHLAEIKIFETHF